MNSNKIQMLKLIKEVRHKEKEEEEKDEEEPSTRVATTMTTPRAKMSTSKGTKNFYNVLKYDII